LALHLKKQELMNERSQNPIFVLTVLLLFTLTTESCRLVNQPALTAVPPMPTLQIAPLSPSHEQWMVATTATVTVTVKAPFASKVRLLSRLEGMEESAEGERLTLGTQTVAQARSSGIFVLQLNLAQDFAGEVWAEADYPDGARRQTESIALNAGPLTEPNTSTRDMGGSVGTDESARSDKLTGGGISRSSLKAGEPDIRLTINLPAFLLTLWQNGKEIKAYHVAIGRKNFPVPVGEREATALIFNPDWIPPNSAWVQHTEGVEPYERITASDPRNPLGKLKIPLGGGYLIHEAARESEIGRAVSHGCIRMRRSDLFDLAEKIILARNLPVTAHQLAQARKHAARLVVPFEMPLLVDINYDLQVIEGNLLRLYPDVYERGAFALDSLRAELQTAKVNVVKIADEQLQQLLNRVANGAQFVISVADIKRGRWQAGGTLPITLQLIARNNRHERLHAFLP
jgi:lipoprotein-anchoring transpeptidase ErfK/SrfK